MQSKHLRLIKVLNQCKIQIVPTKNRIANIYLVFLMCLKTNILHSVHIIYIIYMKCIRVFSMTCDPKGQRSDQPVLDGVFLLHVFFF